MGSERLKTDVSLWSARLASLESEMARMEPFADAFHLDVSDGTMAPSLLFFPALVESVREVTAKPLHAHLITREPARWVDAFVDAGIDRITVHVEAEGAAQAMERVRARGRGCGIAVNLETPLGCVAPFVEMAEWMVAMGTPPGVKGCDLDASAPGRIRGLKRYGLPVFADGGIREQTVPALRAAGADWIVPGSLVFGAADVAAAFEWLWRLKAD
ncbi:MAG: ribulose-phosphate 3-epimerase [Acidobacteria bacterium]|nr:ribulose-phosphate 3-epimerase [Acidobacteriota bacterium]